MIASTSDRNLRPTLSNSAPRDPARGRAALRAARRGGGSGGPIGGCLLGRAGARPSEPIVSAAGALTATPPPRRLAGSPMLAIALPTSAAAAASSAIVSARPPANRPTSARRSITGSRSRAIEPLKHSEISPRSSRHDDDDRVGVLGDAERGAVAGAELGAEVGRARQRQQRARELDPVVLVDHDRAVVELVVLRGHEQRDQQLARQRGIDPRRVVDELLERRVALEHDDRAHARARELRARGDDLVDRVRRFLAAAERQHVRADPAERAPDVLLEHDDDEDDEVADEVVEQPRHGGQLDAARATKNAAPISTMPTIICAARVPRIVSSRR